MAQSFRELSTTLENEAIATVENEATPTDWLGDLGGGLGTDPEAGGRRCPAAAGGAVRSGDVEKHLAQAWAPRHSMDPLIESANARYQLARHYVEVANAETSLPAAQAPRRRGT